MKNNFDILVIDDEQIVIDSVKLVAKTEGYTVDYLMDASMAFYNIANNNYKIIICDIMMPVMDGFKFINELKRKNIKIPVIMTTGYSTLENAARSLNEGAVAFIPKPFTFDEITAIISRCITFSEIIDKYRNMQNNTLLFVPCPPKYLKLGYGFWCNKLDDGSVNIGVSDLFIKTIHSSAKLELLEIGTIINQSMGCAKITGDKDLVHNILAPITGKIIERNEELIENPIILEKDPYFKGWIYKIIPHNFNLEKSFLTNCEIERYF